MFSKLRPDESLKGQSEQAGYQDRPAEASEDVFRLSNLERSNRQHLGFTFSIHQPVDRRDSGLVKLFQGALFEQQTEERHHTSKQTRS